MPEQNALLNHLATGCTTVARAWSVIRRDGVRYGFTDHDRDLEFDGQVFRAGTGLSAKALAQSTGLSVDNTEAMGALTDAAIRESDIAAGRFDDAEVISWLVNWADTSARKVLFRGSIGEIRRSGGAFHAELRGLTEALNRPVGRVFQKPCTAVLGDSACLFDLATPGYQVEAVVALVEENRVLGFDDFGSYEEGWFRRGRVDILSGDAAGLSGAIKQDVAGTNPDRTVSMWQALRARIAPGDAVRLTAGCDKRFSTCRLKFNNGLNYQGFPDIPSEDWMTVHPSQAQRKNGGSRR
ncbi:DUF2163 domain-containing protein [Thalassococcus sp. CAU 1522]|uniref:DUF2163 domain-containing protein n=1 Tax=Thalassococcus arenae TaxID=2851652 RepID=A0ABS6NBB8_9RHOB|nr:DUF2163 domain-containing protein [Thalassococcus arenae]MBV2361321.1 DUF2163 domain-containing protein [Thalassococcus arenae]